MTFGSFRMTKYVLGWMPFGSILDTPYSCRSRVCLFVLFDAFAQGTGSVGWKNTHFLLYIYINTYTYNFHTFLGDFDPGESCSRSLGQT